MSLPREALVLAAGEGRRLGAATRHTPKPLVPFLNVPLLEHVLRRLQAAGVERVWLNAWHQAQRLVEFAARQPVAGLELRVLVEAQLLGTGGGVAGLARQVAGPDLLVLAGDVLADFDLADFAREHAVRGACATMALTPRADPAHFGAVTLDDQGHIVDLAALLGKPTEGTRSLVNASAHLLTREFVENLPSGPSCLVRQGYVPALAAGAPVAGWIHRGRWDETGTERSLTEAQARALGGWAPVDAELLARGGALRPGPCLIHERARVAADARLTDGTTVGPDAEVGAGAELRRCLVLPGARVPAGAHRESAVIAREEPR